MPRWILVDDTDPGITYTGPWTADHGSQDNLGNFGVPLLSTLHGVTSDASFSYSFKGTRALITGTMQYTSSSGPVTNPSWECFVDGVSFQVHNYSIAENRLIFCEKDDLADGVTHNITLIAHVSNQRTFWFDYIQYVPSSSVPLDQALLSVDVPDPQMQFGPGWSQIAPGYTTSTKGSTFKFSFIGVSLTWLGYYNQQLPFAATTASYSIDGGNRTEISLNGVLSTPTGVQYNQIFFQTPKLLAGLHTLEVIYNGDSQTTPLSLSVVFIQNGTCSTASCTTPSATSSATLSATSSTPSFTEARHHSKHSSKMKHSPKIGPIVGGIIGSLIFTIACAFLYTIYRRRRWLLRSKYEGSMEPFSEIATPPSMLPHSMGRGMSSKKSREVAQIERHAHSASVATASSPTASTLPSSRLHLTGSRVQAEAAGSSVGSSSQFPLRNGRFSDATMTPTTNATSSGPRVARDEDSGVRLAHPNEGDVEMLPPEYSCD